jgi:hypothetical protein
MHRQFHYSRPRDLHSHSQLVIILSKLQAVIIFNDMLTISIREGTPSLANSDKDDERDAMANGGRPVSDTVAGLTSRSAKPARSTTTAVMAVPDVVDVGTEVKLETLDREVQVDADVVDASTQISPIDLEPLFNEKTLGVAVKLTRQAANLEEHLMELSGFAGSAPDMAIPVPTSRPTGEVVTPSRKRLKSRRDYATALGRLSSALDDTDMSVLNRTQSRHADAGPVANFFRLVSESDSRADDIIGRTVQIWTEWKSKAATAPERISPAKREAMAKSMRQSGSPTKLLGTAACKGGAGSESGATSGDSPSKRAKFSDESIDLLIDDEVELLP